MLISELVSCGNSKVIETLNHQSRSISKDWLRAIKREGKSYCAWCAVNELPRGRNKYCSDECTDSSTAYCYPQTSAVAFNILFNRQNKKCAHCEFKYDEAILEERAFLLKYKRKSILRLIEHVKVNIPQMKERLKELKKNGLKNEVETGMKDGKYYYIAKIPELSELNKDLKDTKNYISTSLREYFQFKKSGPVFDYSTPGQIRRFHRNLKDHKEPEIDHIIPVALNGMSIGLENVQILCYGCHKLKTKKDMVEIRNLKKTLIVEIR